MTKAMSTQPLENILEAIGRTPIVRLRRIGADLPMPLFAKIEFLNPGGSVKDRMAVHIINKAEQEGRLKPGGTIVESTSGNTGVGLAMVAAVRGYKAIITMPDKMSAEKIGLLKAFGAEVIITPTNVPPDSPESLYETAKRVARETPGSFYANQYYNLDNIEAHYLTTGPELYEQTEGQIDCLIAGVGTGGTISGTGRFLKEKNPSVKVVAIDPEGSIYYDWFKSRTMTEPKTYKVEGIGEDILAETLDFTLIDDMVRINDRESFEMARRLTTEEGIFAGGSSGSALVGAVRWLAAHPEIRYPVVILPDSGSRYLSKIFSDQWMRDNGFLQKTPQLTEQT
ncbi:MAG TPA: cysteine synthase family protein [Acidobacteriota bacterium]|nr:cysteine synthase family protein [Acidobacteriota bacterium]